jgi:RHS repeat-associated protein
MRRLILLSCAVMFLCWVLPAMADAGADLTAYRVKVVLYPGDDGAAVAKRLAATYRGTLETPIDANGSFVIALSPAGAQLMERDPTVERLVVAQPNAVTATAQVPETMAVATPLKLGNYEYDGTGNIRRIGADFFVHDTRNRLTVSGDISTGSVVHKQAYAYDDFGNLTAITTPGSGQTTLSVDTSSNQLMAVGGGVAAATLAYDATGNLTRYGTAAYTYDALNMLTRTTIDGVTRYYIYSASDERIGTVEVSNLGTRSDWTIRDPGGQVLRRLSLESNGEWKWQEDYIYRGTQMLAAEVPDSSKTRHFHLDHLGTPRLITGNGGAELSRHDYHPFGVEIEATSTSSTTIMREKKQFTGHERDAESLDYMHARFYAPYMGRFLSVDPAMDLKATIPNPQMWNRYTYVMNSPLKYTDPTGREADPGEIDGFHLSDEKVGKFIKSLLHVDTLRSAFSGFGSAPANEKMMAMMVGVIALADLGSNALAPEKGVVTKGGAVMLGHFPQYLEAGAKAGARTFSVPAAIWNKLSDSAKWIANQKFLDRALAHGATLYLSTDPALIKKGSPLAKEVAYMADKGYKPIRDAVSGLWVFVK